MTELHQVYKYTLKQYESWKQTRTTKNSWWMCFVFSIWHQLWVMKYYLAILYYLNAPFQILYLYFPMSHLEVLTRTSNSNNALFVQICKTHKTQTKLCNSHKKVFIEPRWISFTFNTVNGTWRSLHRNNFSSSKTSYCEDILEVKKLLRFIMTRTDNRFLISLNLGYVYVTITPKKSLYICLTLLNVRTQVEIKFRNLLWSISAWNYNRNLFFHL